MFTYQFGIVIVTISALSFLWYLFKVKNRIEIDALVLLCEEKWFPSETGAEYYTTQYNVNGKEYIKKCYTRHTAYSEGSAARIYCSKGLFTKEFINITVVNTLGFHLFINIFLLMVGVVSIIGSFIL